MGVILNGSEMGVGVISPGKGWDKIFFSLGVGWDRRENPLQCRPLPPTPPRRRHALNLISRSPIHGPHADYISRLFLLAITAADAVADCSEPPSGKSSHPAPSPKRTCSVLTRGSSHPNSKKLTCRCATRTYGETINSRSCNMLFFFPGLQVRHPCKQLSATGSCPPHDVHRPD